MWQMMRTSFTLWLMEISLKIIFPPWWFFSSLGKFKDNKQEMEKQKCLTVILYLSCLLFLKLSSCRATEVFDWTKEIGLDPVRRSFIRPVVSVPRVRSILYGWFSGHATSPSVYPSLLIFCVYERLPLRATQYRRKKGYEASWKQSFWVF